MLLIYDIPIKYKRDNIIIFSHSSNNGNVTYTWNVYTYTYVIKICDLIQHLYDNIIAPTFNNLDVVSYLILIKYYLIQVLN